MLRLNDWILHSWPLALHNSPELHSVLIFQQFETVNMPEILYTWYTTNTGLQYLWNISNNDCASIIVHQTPDMPENILWKLTLFNCFPCRSYIPCLPLHVPSQNEMSCFEAGSLNMIGWVIIYWPITTWQWWPWLTMVWQWTLRNFERQLPWLDHCPPLPTTATPLPERTIAKDHCRPWSIMDRPWLAMVPWITLSWGKKQPKAM